MAVSAVSMIKSFTSTFGGVVHPIEFDPESPLKRNSDRIGFFEGNMRELREKWCFSSSWEGSKDFSARQESFQMENTISRR